MCLYAHDNFQVNKDFTKRISRNIFNLLNAMPFLEIMIENADITLAASFPCVFATKPTSFLCHKRTAKMVNSIKVNFIPTFGW